MHNEDPFALLEKKRRLSPTWFTALIMLMLVLIAGYLFVNSSYFTVGTVVIEGNKFMEEEEVYRIANIMRPVNILRLNTAEIRSRLLNDLRIAEASVERRLPSTIVINIAERRPIAYVAGTYGFFEIDKQGMILTVYKSLKKAKLPIVTGCKPPGGFVGDKVEHSGLLDMLHYLSLLDETSLSQISEVNIVNPDQIMIYTLNSTNIRLGNNERLDEKAKLTQNILREINAKKFSAEYIDLTYHTPIIKFKQNVVGITDGKT